MVRCVDVYSRNKTTIALIPSTASKHIPHSASHTGKAFHSKFSTRILSPCLTIQPTALRSIMHLVTHPFNSTEQSRILIREPLKPPYQLYIPILLYKYKITIDSVSYLSMSSCLPGSNFLPTNRRRYVQCICFHYLIPTNKTLPQIVKKSSVMQLPPSQYPN